MSYVMIIPIADWNQQCPAAVQDQAIGALENGSVLLFPHLAFPLKEYEAQFLSPTIVARRKHVSLDGVAGPVRGSRLEAAATSQLEAMMRRFAQCSHDLLSSLLPPYKAGLAQGRTSFRPAEIDGRSTAWCKDDTRLHVDSFPSSPVQGKRILRVFCNVNPHGRSRTWRIGEPFERVARRYVPAVSDPLWGSSRLLRWCRVTKSRRSAYDHFMLQLHDRMKADLAYQAGAEQITYDFPPGCTWMVFTDQISHAAMAGQYVLEQTFYVPVTSMQDHTRSPLRILERLTGRALV
jgi:3-deoxy-D-manno-oct-2-ulosonic acid (Kdo) hydroxylase